MNHRQNTFLQLERLGIMGADAAALVRASATLSTWAEHECNGAIQRDEDTGIPYWYNTNTGRKIGRTSDREKGALSRVARILMAVNARRAIGDSLSWYHQGDPRGCALYLLRPGDVPAGEDAGSYYSRGIAVMP